MSVKHRWMMGGVISLPVLAALGLYLWWSNARSKQEMYNCAASLREVGQRLWTYPSDNRGNLPETPELLYPSGSVPVCPTGQRSGQSVGGKPAGSYLFMIPSQKKIAAIRQSVETVAAYEPLSYHGGGMHVLYYDGHVQWLKKDRATALIAELEAGHNPPNVVSEKKKEDED